MKQFALALTLLAATASTVSGRYLVIDMDDVEFVGEDANAPLPIYRSMEEAEYNHHRQRRQAPVELDENQLQQLQARPDYRAEAISERRQGASGIERDAPQGSFLGAIKNAGISSAVDNLASGSSAYHSAPKGSDYVDYGAYTGKHGAFGWYSDHPVLLFGHHH